MKPSENLVKLSDGRVIDRSKVIFVPKEEDGKFKTSDNTRYHRDANGCIRRDTKKRRNK